MYKTVARSDFTHWYPILSLDKETVMLSVSVCAFTLSADAVPQC
jgi:hypothetical protein